MKVTLTDSFFDSIKKINRQHRWYYRAWNLLRYDIPRFFKNVWKFRKELFDHRDWDYMYSLKMLKRNLELLSKGLENGYEIESTRLKKIMMIDRAVQILDNVIHDNYIEMAEADLGMETNTEFMFENDDEPLEIREANSQIFKLASQLQAKEWAELFRILEGPNHDEYVKELEKQKLTGFSGSKIVWEEWYDGTGLSYWWD